MTAFQSFPYSYNEITEQVIRSGAIVTPRGLPTYEITNAVIRFKGGTIVVRSGMNLKLAFLEAMMLVGGIFDLDLIRENAPKSNIKLFEKQSDYGTRVRNQVQLVIEELTNDPFSRRAVIQFNGGLHLGSDNIACTLTAQFMKRGSVLLGTFTMRSWDLVFGFPNDIIMFGALTQAIARCLPYNFDNTAVIVQAASLHVYSSTKHLAEAKENNLMFLLNDEWPNTWPALREFAAQQARDAKNWPSFRPGCLFITNGGELFCPSI